MDPGSSERWWRVTRNFVSYDTKFRVTCPIARLAENDLLTASRAPDKNDNTDGPTTKYTKYTKAKQKTSRRLAGKGLRVFRVFRAHCASAAKRLGSPVSRL